jgi:hypothetical protein
MANYTVNTAKHATLVGSVVDTVTATGTASFVIVTNRATSGTPIFFTVGDAVTGTATPVAAGNDTFGIGPGATLQIPADGTSAVVKLVSADPQPYSLMVL